MEKTICIYHGNGFMGEVHRLSDYPGETMEGLRLSLGYDDALYMVGEMYESLEDYNRDNGTSFATLAELAAANAADYCEEFDGGVEGEKEAAISRIRARLASNENLHRGEP